MNEMMEQVKSSNKPVRKQFVLQLLSKENLHYIALDIEVGQSHSQCFLLDASNDRSFFNGIFNTLQQNKIEKIYFTESMSLSITYNLMKRNYLNRKILLIKRAPRTN